MKSEKEHPEANQDHSDADRMNDIIVWAREFAWVPQDRSNAADRTQADESPNL